jgi:hypothetical protein
MDADTTGADMPADISHPAEPTGRTGRRDAPGAEPTPGRAPGGAEFGEALTAPLPVLGAPGPAVPGAAASGPGADLAAEAATTALPRPGGVLPVPSAPKAAPAVRVVAGDLLLTVNSVDGSEVAACPPYGRPEPVRREAAELATRAAAAASPPPPGPRLPELPLLEREEERERVARLLAHGRSVRVTGPSGAGRSVLLDAVAGDCAEVAPDGVIRLSGYHRTPDDLLQLLYEAAYATEGDRYRPEPAVRAELLRGVGAIVVVDDVEFGGAELESLLSSAPECAFLLAALPDAPAPLTDSLVEEVFLPGLTRVACLDLLEEAVGRPLEEDELAWAADLWFESEGLPLRFVQAAGLLRARTAPRGGAAPEVAGAAVSFAKPASASGTGGTGVSGDAFGAARGVPGAASAASTPAAGRAALPSGAGSPVSPVPPAAPGGDALSTPSGGLAGLPGLPGAASGDLPPAGRPVPLPRRTPGASARGAGKDAGAAFSAFGVREGAPAPGGPDAGPAAPGAEGGKNPGGVFSAFGVRERAAANGAAGSAGASGPAGGGSPFGDVPGAVSGGGSPAGRAGAAFGAAAGESGPGGAAGFADAGAPFGAAPGGAAPGGAAPGGGDSAAGFAGAGGAGSPFGAGAGAGAGGGAAGGGAPTAPGAPAGSAPVSAARQPWGGPRVDVSAIPGVPGEGDARPGPVAGALGGGPLAPATGVGAAAPDVPGAAGAGALPSLVASAAPAELLAERLSASARAALRYAVVLGGDCPHHAHLPALVGDSHADAALGEIVAAGLAVPVAGHFRLAAGVERQLAGTVAGDEALTAAKHYAWWVAHPSVSTGRAAAEAEAVLAALAAARDAGEPAAAVELARAAAPVFAAALAWSAWERALRIGLEAARQSGRVAEEAYFQHELGVLALCTDDLERARTELEASLALRGALSDRHGSTVGRRTLALIADRQGEPAPGLTGAEATAAAVFGTPSGGIPRVRAAVAAAATAAAAATTGARRGGRRGVPPAPRGKRPLVLAGAGVLLVAAVGTAVAMGTSGSGGTPHHGETSSTSRPAGGAAADGDPTPAATGSAPASSASPSGSPSASPSSTGSPTPLGDTGESPSASASESTSPSTSPSPSSSKKATKSPSPKPTKTRKPGSTGGSSGGSSSTGGSSTTGGGSTSTTGSTSSGTGNGGTTGSTTSGSSAGSSSTGGSSTTDGGTTDGGTDGSTTDGSTDGTPGD